MEGAETVLLANFTLCPSELPPAHVHVTVVPGETWILTGSKKSLPTVTMLLAAAQNCTEVADENVTLGGPVERATRRRV